MAAWETDEIRPRRPTPVDEAIAGLLIFEQTLWDAVPRFLRSLDGALRGRDRTSARARGGAASTSDRGWAATATAIRPSRHEVTQLACRGGAVDGGRPLRARNRRAQGRTVDDRRDAGAPGPRRRRTRALSRRPSRGSRPPARDPRSARPRARTRRSVPVGCAAARNRTDRAVPIDFGAGRAAAALPPIAHRRPGRASSPSGRLTDLLRRTAAFGLTLVRLDVRQHASRHAAALTAITEHLGPRPLLRLGRGRRSSRT